MATHFGSLRSSTAYPSSSSTIHGFCIYTYFYYEVLQPGKTKITWSFQAGYDNYGSYPASSTYASADISLTLTATKGTISEITGTSYSGSSIKYKSWPTLGNGGSCIITHNSSGEASFNVYANVGVGGWDCDSSTSFTVPINIPYTACGAPTSISASGIIKPNGSFTISWSGATNGVSNNIKSYQVYWYVTSNGTAPSASTYTGTKEVDVTDGTTSGSYTVNLSNATRGYKVVCGVKALSSIGSAYDSNIKTGGSVTINSLPAAPTVLVNKTVVPSTGGQVIFTVTAGADADNSQTKTLYYSTSTTGSKTKITSPWSPTISATSTYYFWTYDGMEYSSSSSSGITITKNTKPTFSVSISSQSLASANNSSGYDYTISPTITLSNISGGQSNKTYTYKLLYGVNSGVTSSKELTGLSSTATQNTIDDIRKESIGHESHGAFYRISVQCFDGIEYSDEMKTSIRYVTRVPSLKGIYNKADFTNIEGFYDKSNQNIATHHSKFLGFVFERDAGYNVLLATLPNGAFLPVVLSTDSKDTRGTLVNSDELTDSISYNLSCKIGYTSGYLHSATTTYPITKIAKVELNNFIFGKKEFRFFTDSGTYSNTVGHSYSTSPLTSGNLKEYGIAKSLSSSHLSAQIWANSKWSNSFSLTPDSNVTNNNTIGFNISSTTLVNNITNLFTSNQKNMTYSATIRLYITNDFGDQSYTESGFIINFTELDSIVLVSKKIYSNEDKEKHAIDEWEYLKEKMGSLIGEFKIESYNTNPKGEIQIKRSGETNWTSLKRFEFSAVPEKPTEYTASNILVQDIQEISNPKYSVSYQLVISTDSGEKTLELYNNILVRGHIPATLTIQNSSYDGAELTVGYNVNFGADAEKLELRDGTVSLYLDGENTAKNTYTVTEENFFSSSSKKAYFIYNFSGSESSLIKLGITTILYTYLKNDTSKHPYFGTTKTTNLNAIAAFPIFNILPTVAYRKNHLGINVLNPSDNGKENAIIVIGETSGRDTIYFQPASTNLCKVVNFHLDGGTW